MPSVNVSSASECLHGTHQCIKQIDDKKSMLVLFSVEVILRIRF